MNAIKFIIIIFNEREFTFTFTFAMSSPVRLSLSSVVSNVRAPYSAG